MGMFTSHRADEDDAVFKLGPLTVVTDGGDWVIAVEEYDAFYDDDGDGDDGGPFEAEPYGDWCLDCDGYFYQGEDSGRVYCGCGFWYDRQFWGL